MNSGLHADSIIKSFGTKQVLTDVFISCKKGEIIGLLGRNGSGKSTLLKIIFGSLLADRKFIKVDAKLINGLYDSRELVKYLPHDNFLPAHVKIKHAISLFCDSYNADIVKSNELIRPLLEKRCRQLSGGERRLVEICMIIYSNGKYILIDEPFNGISPVYKEDIKNLILEHSKEKGFIITDHDYNSILDIATKTILIHDGSTKVIKNKNELKYWGYMPEIS